MDKITPFLMFYGEAEAAMQFYTDLFEDAEIGAVFKYGPGEQGKEGTIMHATFTLNGNTYQCIDSALEYDFKMTPAISLFIQCSDEEEIDRFFTALSEGGEVLMPLDKYPFAQKYAWVTDRFGVSWQMQWL